MGIPKGQDVISTGSTQENRRFAQVVCVCGGGASNERQKGAERAVSARSRNARNSMCSSAAPSALFPREVFVGA